jgi:hypothetical protein
MLTVHSQRKQDLAVVCGQCNLYAEEKKNERAILRQQHIDCKITDALLKKGTKKHTDGWNTHSKVRSHIVLHLPHSEGGFGVTFNDVTKDAAFYSTTSCFVTWMGVFSQTRQELWLSVSRQAIVKRTWKS